MKRNHYIISGIMTIVGLILIFISILLVDFDLSKLTDGSKAVEKTYTLDFANIDNIYIKAVDEHITVTKTSSNEIKITYYEDKKHKYNIEQDGNNFSFERKSFISLFNLSFFDFMNKSVTIELPEKLYNSIEITNVSGGILIEDINCNTFKAKATSGSVKVNNIEAASVELINTSGKISADNIKTNEFESKNTSGSTVINNIETNIASAKNTSGRISVTNITANDLTLKNTSGSINAYIIGNKEEYNVEVTKTSGSSNVGDYTHSGNTKNINVKNTSGSIKVNFSQQ